MGKKVRLTKIRNKRNQTKLINKRNVKQKKRNQICNKDKLLKSTVKFSKSAVAEKLFSLNMDDEDYLNDSNLERQYEINNTETMQKRKVLLPIKTKTGIIPIIQVEEDMNELLDASEKDEEMDSDDTEKTDETNTPKVVTATQLFITHNKTLDAKKIQIGSLSASILENPNEKLHNFKTLFQLLKDDELEDYLTLKKLIIVSLLEVFKDLLPSYEIKQTLDKGVKLKKDTLKLEKFETLLLQYYKKFLQHLEQMSSKLIKKYSTSASDNEKILAELSINALCDLLYVHPYFNYAENIAQTVVPFLNHPKRSVREKVNITCKNIFREDLKGEITMKILRIINQNVKKFSFNVFPEMLEVLLHLKIKDVNIDQERENKLKQKKLMAHKSNVLQLSKNERKKKARIQELEKSLLEVKAEESKQVKQKCLTEITKIAFGIFFKILKSSNDTKIVGISLQGISKYAQCINMEFYVDLINILDQLLKADWLHYCEQQRCIQTIFIILGQQGEILNLDPVRFYTRLYESLLTTHASRNSHDFSVVVETLIYALIKRQKKITTKRMASFLKRIMTLSLQLLHNGTLSCLTIGKSLLQFNSTMDVLLDLESSLGDGYYLPELNDPEYCNASSTALFELTLLRNHYHPTVTKYSKFVTSGAKDSLENDICIESRSSADELYRTYDMSNMCFNPSIPAPKKVVSKIRLKNYEFCNSDFKKECVYIVKNYLSEECKFLT